MVAITFAAIVLTGTGFMIWFLLALVRERGPSTFCWIVPIRRELERKNFGALRGSYPNDDGCATESGPSDYCVELLENEDQTNACASGLIALDVCPVPASVIWRSSPPGSEGAFHKRRILVRLNKQKTRKRGMS